MTGDFFKSRINFMKQLRANLNNRRKKRYMQRKQYNSFVGKYARESIRKSPDLQARFRSLRGLPPRRKPSTVKPNPNQLWQKAHPVEESEETSADETSVDETSVEETSVEETTEEEQVEATSPVTALDLPSEDETVSEEDEPETPTATIPIEVAEEQPKMAAPKVVAPKLVAPEPAEVEQPVLTVVQQPEAAPQE